MPVDRQAQPLRHVSQLRAQSVQGALRRARLEMDRLRKQSAGLPVGLQVHPPDEAVAVQKRDDVIAMLVLPGGHIDLEA